MGDHTAAFQFSSWFRTKSISAETLKICYEGMTKEVQTKISRPTVEKQI